MKNNNSCKLPVLLLLVAILSGMIVACAQTSSMVAKHPVDVIKMPVCSDCHTDWRGSLNHTADFDTQHRFYASQRRQACLLCHPESYCADCHGYKEEIKPSDKYKGSPEMAMPHRGDYITQHKIEGRLDPASCFPCHGRRNDARCIACHR